METVVYLIRHSEVASKNNINIIKDSSTDQLRNEKSILSVSGEVKARELSQNKELQNLHAIYSSSYVRAIETAKYLAYENKTIINIDERLNERKIGNMVNMTWKDFNSSQVKDFDYKLPNGESLNQTKKRMVEAMKNILMFENENRVAVISHSTSLTCLLSAWCEMGKNYDDDIILSFNEETIVDGNWDAPMVYKVVFDGMNVKSIEIIK